MLKTVGNPSTRYGDQTIIDGNLVIGTAGKGIDFSADPSAAGMTSELLDDYEEGTWTPSFASSNIAETFTGSYSQRAGYYVKVGSLVFVTCFVATADSLTLNGLNGANQLFIRGLPFTSANLSLNEGVCPIQNMSGMTFSGFAAGFVPANASWIRVRYSQSNSAVSNLTVTEANNGTGGSRTLALSGCYRAT
jgi:hypothetical protein